MIEFEKPSTRLIVSMLTPDVTTQIAAPKCRIRNKLRVEYQLIAEYAIVPTTTAIQSSGSESDRRCSGDPLSKHAARKFNGISNIPINNTPRLVFRSFQRLSV